MTKISATRALFLAAGLLAAPGLAQAADLYENTNNASATGSPFAYAMPVTRSADQGPMLRVGNSAAPAGSPLRGTLATSQARDGLQQAIGNSASAIGGPGTGPVRG